MTVQVIAHQPNQYGWGVSLVETNGPQVILRAFTLHYEPTREAQDEYFNNAVEFFTGLVGCVERVDQR